MSLELTTTNPPHLRPRISSTRNAETPVTRLGQHSAKRDALRRAIVATCSHLPLNLPKPSWFFPTPFAERSVQPRNKRSLS